jgi:hypothetical protein
VKQFGFQWAASGSSQATDPAEWMWDGGAFEKIRGWTSRQPLILECEWGRHDGDVKDDFEKLIVSRADLRVMVFWRNAESEAAESFQKFETGAKESSISEPGDRYLLVCYFPNIQRVTFKSFIVPNHTAQVGFAELTKTKSHEMH